MTGLNKKYLVTAYLRQGGGCSGFYQPVLCGEKSGFDSLEQMFLDVDRTFAGEKVSKNPVGSGKEPIRRGRPGHFVLSVLSRENGTWKGQIGWKEREVYRNFRSCLELAHLMEEAVGSLNEMSKSGAQETWGIPMRS